MPRKGYTSLTLKDHSAQIIQMHGAVHPKGQSKFVEDVIGFMAENQEAFDTYVREHNPLTTTPELTKRHKILRDLPRPLVCFFCGEIVEKNIHIHSVDGNHENWDPENKVPTHQDCHLSHHALKRRGTS